MPCSAPQRPELPAAPALREQNISRHQAYSCNLLSKLASVKEVTRRKPVDCVGKALADVILRCWTSGSHFWCR
ncbi:uncharacterized [Tachysurus ichikawai]